MSEKNFKDLLVRHIEKLALGLVVFVILVYLISLAVSTTDAQRLKRDSSDAIDSIEEAINKPWVPDEVTVNYLEELKAPFDPKNIPQPGRESSPL